MASNNSSVSLKTFSLSVFFKFTRPRWAYKSRDLILLGIFTTSARRKPHSRTCIEHGHEANRINFCRYDMNQTSSPSPTTEAPYYLPLADEVEVFQAAYASRLPVLLKGPTGCGKTRFVEHMSWQLDYNLSLIHI